MIFEEIPTPLQLGLQHRFWRPYQQEAIKRIAESPKKIVILQAPPGIGKSAIALGLLRYLDTKGIILTNTINLQLQYLREGDRIVETVFGRANYPCVLPRYDFDLATQMGVTETTTADNAPCLSGFRCEYKNVCPYYEEKAKAEASPITVLNYSYWLSISRHVGDFTDSEIIVADEGHLLDRALTDDFSVKLSSEMVSTMASKGYERPKLAVLSDEWCKYANDGEWVCKTSSEEFSGPCVEKTKWDNWMRVFSRLYFLGLVDEEWPKWIGQDDEGGGVQFVPLWPEYIHEAFFSIWRTQKLVIMSASILDPKKFAEMYGLVETDYEYIDLPWVFSKTHRPIHYRPVAKVTERNLGKALKPLAQAIRYIMDKYAGEKGIIHTRSFKLLQLLQF
jgi:Rad3-related DNA helicase